MCVVYSCQREKPCGRHRLIPISFDSTNRGWSVMTALLALIGDVAARGIRQQELASLRGRSSGKISAADLCVRFVACKRSTADDDSVYQLWTLGMMKTFVEARGTCYSSGNQNWHSLIWCFLLYVMCCCFRAYCLDWHSLLVQLAGH